MAIIPCLAVGDERTSVPILLQGDKFVELRNYPAGIQSLIGALPTPQQSQPDHYVKSQQVQPQPGWPPITIVTTGSAIVSKSPFAFRWDGALNRPAQVALMSGTQIFQAMKLRKRKWAGPGVISGVQQKVFGSDVVVVLGAAASSNVTSVVWVTAYATNAVFRIKSKVQELVGEVVSRLSAMADAANQAASY